MSSSAVVENGRRGILAKMERMNSFFGGWHSLLRGRNGRNKKLKRETKLASASRLASFGREFRGRLMLEPLEERIVPAVVNLLPGEYMVFDAGAVGTFGVVAYAGSAGADPIEVDYNSAAGIETINEIGLQGDGAPPEAFSSVIITNFGATQAGGTLSFNSTDGEGAGSSTNVRTAPNADTINVSIITGQDPGAAGGGPNFTISFPGISGTFNLAAVGGDQTGGAWVVGSNATALGSNITDIVMDGSAATVNLDANTGVLGAGSYAVTIPAIGLDTGDINAIDVNGNIASRDLNAAGITGATLTIDEGPGAGPDVTYTLGDPGDRYSIQIEDFGGGTQKVTMALTDASLNSSINFTATGAAATFGITGTITANASLTLTLDEGVPTGGTIDVGSVTTSGNLVGLAIDDGTSTTLSIGGAITGAANANADGAGQGSFGSITAAGISGTGSISAVSIGTITSTGDIADGSTITSTGGGIGDINASSSSPLGGILGVITSAGSISNISATTTGVNIGNIGDGDADNITAATTIGNITAAGAINSAGNITANEGIGAVQAGTTITIVTLDGNADGNATGSGITSVKALGGGITFTNIRTTDGGDTSPSGPSIGEISATGGNINGTTIDSGGSLTVIKAIGTVGTPNTSIGNVTAPTIHADGDIDEVSSSGTGTVTATIKADAAVVGSPIFTLTSAGITYTIDVTGPFTSAGVYFAIGLVPAGATPDVALMNVAGTTSATNISITTSNANYVDVIGIDIDDRNVAVAGPPFFPPFPFAAVIDPDWIVGPVEKEANLGNIKIEGSLGALDGPLLGPGFIDFDTGAAVNNLGDVTSIVIDNGVVANSIIEVESLSALAIGNLTAVPVGLVQSVEAVITELRDVVLFDPDGFPGTALFITTDVTKAFGEMVVLTGTGAGSTATIDYIDGNDDGLVGGTPAGAAGDGFIVGNVVLPAAGFESTVGVASITETGEGTPLLGFIEVAGPLGTVTLTDSNTTNATPANINSISVGFNIGLLGVDDPVVPADFLETSKDDDDADLIDDPADADLVDTFAGNANGVWMANPAANLTSVQVDGDLGNAASGTDVALAVTGSVGTAGSNAIRLRSFGTAGNSDLAGDVLIGDNLLGNVVVDGEIDNSGPNNIFAVGVAKKGEIVVGTQNTVNFASGSIGSALNPVTFQANTTTGPGPAAINSNDVDINIVAAENIWATVDAADDVDGDIVAITGSITGTIRTRGADFGTGNDGDIRGDIIAGTFINVTIAAAVDPATGNPLPGTVSGDITGNTIRSGNGDITGLIAASDDIDSVSILAGNNGTVYTTGNMLADIRAGVGGVSGGIGTTVTIAAANDVGAAGGSTDIVASGNITGVTIVAGAALGLAGNFNADVLAGVTGAVVGLTIDQTTGAVGGGSFDGAGNITNVIIRADGRVGTADGLRNVAANDAVDGLALIAQGAAINTGAFNLLQGPDLGGAGITGSGSALNFADLGAVAGVADAAETDQDVLMDVNAGAPAGDQGATAALTELVIIADHRAGLETSDGFNTLRADRNVGSDTLLEGAIVVAGMGDASGDQEEINYTVLAGFGIDRTVVSGSGNISNFRGYADDDYGSVDAAKDTDGLFATSNIGNVELAAGTDAISDLIPSAAVGFFKGAASLSALSTRDAGGSFLMNVEATGSLGATAGGATADNFVVASNDVGQNTAEGINTLRGSSGIFGLNVLAITGGIYTDVIAGSTSNDPTSGTVVANADMIETNLLANTDIGLAAQATDGVVVRGVGIGIDGIVFANRSMEDVTVASTTGNVFVNVVARTGSIETNGDAAPAQASPNGFVFTAARSEGTLIYAGVDVGVSPEGTNFIYAGTFIGVNNALANIADATVPTGFNVRIEGRDDVLTDVIANGGNIDDTIIRAYDEIGTTGQNVNANLATALGVIRANNNIQNTAIQAGQGTFGGTHVLGQGEIFVNIIAGFGGTGSFDPVIIEADLLVGEAPEGTNIIFASTNIGIDNGVNNSGTPGSIPGNPDFIAGPATSGNYDVFIDAGNSATRAVEAGGNDSYIYTDIIALSGNIEDTAVTADDNIGSTGQILGVTSNETRVVPNVVGLIGIAVDPDQIDSDGLTATDNPQGIIQAGDYIERLTVVAGEFAIEGVFNTADIATSQGSVLASIIAGADGLNDGGTLDIRDLVNSTGGHNASGKIDDYPNFDGINGLVLLADDDLGEPRAGNIITAADSIDITNMSAGLNLETTSGLDANNTNTAAGQPDTAGDVSMDIIAGTRLFGPAGSAPDVKGGIVITSGPQIIADSGLPFAANINDSNLPGPDTMTDDIATDGDQITILNLDIAKGGIFVPDLASTAATQEGNGNLNGTFVAGSDLTLIDAEINGNLVGDDGSPGGRTLVAGASYSGNWPDGVFLTVQLTIPGVFTGPFSAGTLVPFDMGAGSFIGTNAGPFQAGTVITTGTIQGEIQAGRFDGSGNGVVADGNGIQLAEVLSGEEGLADAGFVPTTTFGATGDIRLDLLAIGRPFISPQSTPGQEPYDFGDGDYVNFSMFALGDIENDSFFSSGPTIDDIKDGNVPITNKLDAGITAKDAINLNFILANADAITAIDADINQDGGFTGEHGDPSTPSTLKPQNSAFGDLSVNIRALGHGDGAEGGALSPGVIDADGAPNGISGGPIAAGFDPFVLIDTTVLPSNAPAGSVVQDPKVPANAFGSRYGNAFGLGNIEGDILALDNDATDGLEQGDITLTWIAAGESITTSVDIGAQDDIAMTGDDGTEGALIPGVDLDIAAGLSANGLLAAFSTSGQGNLPTLTPGGNINGDIVAGDDIFSTDNTGDDAGLIFIAAQGGGDFDTGSIGEGSGLDGTAYIVSGVEDQVDDQVFVPPVGTAPTDATGGLGSNIRALIITSLDMDGVIGAGYDPLGAFDNFFSLAGGGVWVGGGGGFSTETGASYGSFYGTIVAGAGVDLLIDNFNLASPVLNGEGRDVNLDNHLATGDINEVDADSDITFIDYTISSLDLVLNGAIATEDINYVSAGWGDPVATGIITGDMTAGRDIGTILASKRIGNAGDLIAAGRNISLIQAGDPSSAAALGVPVPSSAAFAVPLIDSVGTVAADIFTGGTLSTVLAGGGKGDQLTDANVNNDGITGNLFLGEFSGQGTLKFGEAGQVASLTFNDSADKNIVEIPEGDLSASLDMILTDGGVTGTQVGGVSGVNGFTLTFNGTATGLPFSLDELIIADDLIAPIVVDQGSIGRLVIDDDAIDRLVAEENARDAFNTTIPLPNMPAIFLQLYDGDLSRTVMSRQFNEDDADSAALVEFADMLANITVRDDIGLGPAVGEGEPGVFIEGSMRGATLESILGNIGDIHIGIDLYDSTIKSDIGTIGNIFVGDDIQGTSVGVDIIADLGIGDIEVQDSIIGNVTIQAISGSIGDITVGTAVDAIGDPGSGRDNSLTDADGLGIDGNGVSGGVDILARDNIGDITVVHGNITDDVTIETDVSYFGDIGDIVVLHGDISRGVTFEADGSVGNIFVGILPGDDGIIGTEDDVVLVNDEGIGEIRQGVDIIARSGGIGNITVADDMEQGVSISASKGGIGEIRVYDDLQHGVSISTAVGSGGEFGGLFVGTDLAEGVWIDIDGAIKELTQITGIGDVTGAVLVGGSILGAVSIQAASIGAAGNALVVGIKGVGNIDPKDDTITIRARGANGNIGDITVRDIIGGDNASGGVDIISEDGAVGNIVAGQIGVSGGGDIYVEAEEAIGDIVTLDDSDVGIVNTTLHVNSATGRIGDIIAHGDITDLSFIKFDGSIGDVVSLNGVVTLNGLTLGGSMGDIYASEDINLNGIKLEAGSLGDDGTVGWDDASLPDQALTSLDGLNRTRPEGAPEDGITSQLGSVLIAQSGEFQVSGDVGNIQAFLRVAVGWWSYPDQVNIGGNLGSVESWASRVEIWNIDVLGNVGDISAFQLVGISDMDVGGNVGNITSLSDGVHIEYTLIGGNVGNVTGTAEGVYTDGVYISETLIGGNIGNITGISQSGNGVAMNSVHIRGNVGNLIGDVGGYGGEGISLHGVLVDGSVGNITGTSQDDSGVYLEGVSVVGDVGNIEAPIGWLEVYGTAIGGSVGDITAFLGVFLGDDEGGDHVRIGGDVGNITSETTHVDIVNVIVGGDVGLIKGFGTPWGGPSVYIEGFNVGGDITGIVGVAGDVTLNYMTVGGNIGDITSEAGNVNFDPYNYNEGPSGGGDWEWGNIQVVGNIGNITAFLDVNIHGAYDYDYYYYDGYYGAGINVGGSVGNITAITGDIDVYNFSVAGSIGNITALDSVRMGDDYYDYYYEGGLIRVGGSVGNITSLTSFISLGGGSGVFHVAGSVGNITGEYYVEMSYVGVGGNVGNITSKFEYIDIGEKVEVVGNVGNISAFLDLTLGYGGEGGTQYGFAIGGTLGTAVSLKGDITADLVVDGNIADIYAAEGDIYSATIVSGGNIGSFALGTGVRAGNFIWDDVTIVAKGTIGVVEARVLGYSTQYIDTLPGTITIGTTVLVPDNDLSMDFQNDYLVIADSNDDNIIELSPVIQAYMASNGYLPDEVTPRSELLVDGKIDSQEALDIIAFGGEKLPDIWDPLNTDTVDIIFQNIFKEVEIIDVDDVVSTELNIDVYNLEPNFSYLTIIAEGTDPSSTVRAIGRISSTVMTTTDLYVDAVRGGIGELSSYGILALSDERIVDIAESRGLLPSSISIEELRAILAGGTITPPQTVDDNGEEINIPGDDRGEDELDFAALLAGGDDLAKGIIRAKTSIDTLRGDDGLLDLDIQVTGGITINPSLPLDQMITTTGGVGLVGGIVSAGEMEINIVTGGSIGTTVTTGGSINNNYDAFGNIGSIIAKDNITGTYTAAMGYIGNAISGTGQARFVSGGVLAASGDISADFKTGLGMGNLAAPLGNVSGSLTTGGVVKGENPDYVIESSGADDDDFEVNLSTAAIKLYSVFTTLDTDSATPAPASMTVGSQTIDVTGSSSGLRVNVGVAFGFATDMTVTGSGSLDFDSTGDVGVMTVEPGANVSVSSINVDGDFGGFININKNAKVANITATEDIGQVIGYGSVQNITAGEDIGEVKSLFKDVKNVFAGDDIDKIFAKTNVQNIGAQDRIGEIIAGKNVKIVRAYEIGTISAANVSQVFALGDIDLISASGNVTDVSSGGDITVEAGKNATRIAGASGKVAAGGKLSKVSCSLEKCSPPPPVPVYVDC